MTIPGIPIPGSYQQAVIDPNRKDIQEKAHKLAVGLVERLGVGDSVAVSLLVVEELMVGILHLESPMPETNIELLRKMLNTLKGNVLQHSMCHSRLNNAKETNGVVH